MKPVSLSLKPDHPETAPDTTAGWIPSSSPEVWLTEVRQLCDAGLSTSPDLIPVTLDGVTHGAVVLLPHGTKGQFSQRVSPLQSLLPNVLSLQSAGFSLGLLEQEIRFSAFPKDLYLFLPSLGLVELSKNSILSAGDFVILEKANSTWNHALPGPVPPPALTGITINLPEPEELRLSADGIGDLQGRKPKGQGPLGGIKKGIGLGLAGLAAGPILGLGKILSMMPGTSGSSSPSSFDKLEAWAKRHWKEIMDARQRELNRLMDMMEKNPDEGLRYALPLGGHEARRGKAPPGWTLGSRSLRLGGNQGGSPVDGWDLDYQTQLKLEEQYRKAAASALADENYERAAYIYGELLNDWSSAAQALIKGGRLREAVSIFLHKLSDKNRAAQALEEAGLHLQAAEMYLELGQNEKAGDLYQVLGQSKRARDLWSRAAGNEKNPLERARILDEKLEDRQAAISVLDEAWRSNSHSASAIKAQFKLHLKTGDPAPIKELVREFTSAPPSIFLGLEKARLCLAFKNELLPEPYHSALEETVLRLTSNQLTHAPSSKSGQQLLNILKGFREKDELLARDTNRFVSGSKTIKLPATERPNGHFTHDFDLGIPQEGVWQSLASLGQNVSIAGSNGDSLIVAQLQGRSCMGSALATPDFPPGNRGVFHIGLSANPHKARVFHFFPHKRIHFRSINTQRTPAHNALGGLQNVLGIGPIGAESFMTLQYQKTGSLVADHYLANGTKLESTVLDLAPPELAKARWYCAGRDQHACFSALNFCAWRYPDGQFTSCQLNEPITKLSLSPGSHPLHALISSDHEAALVTPSQKSGKPPEFINLTVNDGEFPVASTFAKNGDAIVASGYRGEIFSPSKLGEPVATFGFPKNLGHAIDIAPRGPFGYVILTSKGRLVLFD